MHAAGCLSGAPANPPTEVPRDAILGFVASAPSPLIVVSLEDLLGMQEQPNLPGTSTIGQTAHPNWMQALPMDVEQHFSDDRSEVHTSELQSLMRISYAVICLIK